MYVNVEQPDNRFLKNRLAWEKDRAYLYKQAKVDVTERKEVGCEDDRRKINSPTYQSLAFPSGVAREPPIACLTR